jgi:DNA polymerase (family 10)
MVKDDDIANMFEAIADLPAFDDAGPFRIRAHRIGARTLRSYIEEMNDLIGRGGDLTELPAIGDDLAALIAEAVLTGRMRTLDNLRASAPIPSPDILEVEGTGPKPARALWQALGISAPQALHRAVLDRRVRTVPGFSKKTEARLAEVFAKAAPARSGRWPIGQFLAQDGSLRSYTATIPVIRRAETAGSFRQGRDRVGDLDTVIETEESRGALGQLLDWSRFKRIAAMGNTRATAILDSGLQVDVRTTRPEGWGAMLQYFTGSKPHSIALRIRAKRMGLKLNEYGVWRGDKRIAGRTEAEVYAAPGLALIPPELRENRGEIELAASGNLPKLVTRQALRGDLHCIVSAPGQVPDLLQAATEAALDHVGIGPRNTPETPGPQARAILQAVARDAKKRSRLTCFRVVEAQVDTRGGLALCPDIAAECDLVIAAVNNGVHITRPEQTERLIRAVSDPRARIVSHPTGRQLATRGPFDVKMDALASAAASAATVLELSAGPARMDRLDRQARLAAGAGALIAVTAEAESPPDFGRLDLGVTQARRGWLRPDDNLNPKADSEMVARLRVAPSAAMEKEVAHAG